MNGLWLVVIYALGSRNCIVNSHVSVKPKGRQDSCVYDYQNFEKEVMAANNIHSMLESAFYQPNNQFPYSVIARYSTVMENGTHHSLSTDPTCSKQVWSWNSASVFSITKPTSANIYSLYTMNYFRSIKVPHVDIVVPQTCANATFRLLLRMTSLLHKYASGEDEVRLGYTEMGCGTHESNTMFHFPYEGSQQNMEEYFLYAMVNFLPLTMCIAVNLFFVFIAKPKVEMLIQHNYSSLDSPQDKERVNESYATYATYGLPWGIVTSATILSFALFGLDLYTAITVLPAYKGVVVSFFPVINFMFMPIIPTLLPTLYMWLAVTKRKWPIPYIYYWPATIICGGNKIRGEKLVIGVAIYTMLVMSCLVAMHALAIVVSSVASLHAVGLSATILILVVISVTDIFALLFTVSSYCCTRPQYRKPADKKIMVNTFILIPLLFAVILICILPLSCCNSVGVESSQNQFLATLGSLPSPIIGLMVVIGQRKLITFAMQPKPSTSCNSDGEIAENPKPLPKKLDPVQLTSEDNSVCYNTGNKFSNNPHQMYGKTIFLHETLL